ncbi:Cysteine-rich protein [Spironucleus salmonicida]|uniref:Cysteine-rich protein n=1 Tax=Spironucleus salmonicida TaxID=348837 RepID=V6LYV8_9EUKA|nr:Cysteine-rich protein [Spironucleus salmonicida]|eukprot:EST46014.1 Cysteine-rich protein [Spironucleus salmonicida]
MSKSTNELLFPQFPKSPVNDQLCFFCLESQDDVVFCDGFCQKSYCRSCLGLSGISSQEYICPHCLIGVLRCELCHMADNTVIKCAKCSYAVHLKCAMPLEEIGFYEFQLPNTVGILTTTYLCQGCSDNIQRCFRCTRTEDLLQKIDDVQFCQICCVQPQMPVEISKFYVEKSAAKKYKNIWRRF